jgi:tRNA (Thr-GGU) A37 N-methylase
MTKQGFPRHLMIVVVFDQEDNAAKLSYVQDGECREIGVFPYSYERPKKIAAQVQAAITHIELEGIQAI